MKHAAAVHEWHTEHVYFRRTGERPNYELMVDILRYLREFCDRVHHPREDAAFACLARHVPEMQLPLARLQQEHRVIAHAGQSLSERIAREEHEIRSSVRPEARFRELRRQIALES